MKFEKLVRRIKARKKFRNRSREYIVFYQKSENFWYFGAAFPPPVAIEVKFCTAKWTHVPVRPAKFDANRCNESPLRDAKPDFGPVSKFNNGSLPLRGNPAGENKKHTNTMFSHLQPARVLRSSQNFAGWYSSSCHSFFDPTHSFSYRYTEKFSLIDPRAVSQR